MPVDPLEILREVDPTQVPADSPPGESNYREADLAGVACAFCAKMRFVGFREEDGVMIPQGVCDQWEATVDGVNVCDLYADSGPALDEDGREVWSEFADHGQPVEYHEIHLAGTKAERRGGKLLKGVLRTGHWPVTPTPIGKLKKPLTIIRDGKSDPVKGIIALSEIVKNFKAKRPLKKVLVPFSDKKDDDHVKDGNLARLNTGFVDDLFIEDEGDVSHLMAEIRFTDGETEKMVLDGSVDDVSSGIPYHSKFGAWLEHVALTPYPFIEGQKGWIAASDAPQAVKDAEVVHHILKDKEDSEEQPPAETEEETPPETEETPPTATLMSFRRIVDAVTEQLEDLLPGTASSYRLLDATTSTVTIRHDDSKTTWTAPFTVADDKLALAPVDQWVVETQEGDAEPPSEETAPPSTSKHEAQRPGEDNELYAARRLREMRLAASAQHPTNTTGGDQMTVISREDLDRLELSDQQRAVFENLIDENATLAGKTREQEADARIEELKGWGFSERPGFLKLYRRAYLSDDGGPAIVLLSDDGSEAKEKKTALALVDDLIEALVGPEHKVEFSDIATESGNDTPPRTSDGPDRPVADRAKDMREFLYGTSN